MKLKTLDLSDDNGKFGSPYIVDIENSHPTEVQDIELFGEKAALSPYVHIESAIPNVSYSNMCHHFKVYPIVIGTMLFEVVSTQQIPEQQRVSTHLKGLLITEDSNGTIINVPFDTLPVYSESDELFRVNEMEFRLDRYTMIKFTLPPKSKIRARFFPFYEENALKDAIAFKG